MDALASTLSGIVGSMTFILFLDVEDLIDQSESDAARLIQFSDDETEDESDDKGISIFIL